MIELRAAQVSFSLRERQRTRRSVSPAHSMTTPVFGRHRCGLRGGLIGHVDARSFEGKRSYGVPAVPLCRRLYATISPDMRRTSFALHFNAACARYTQHIRGEEIVHRMAGAEIARRCARVDQRQARRGPVSCNWEL